MRKKEEEERRKEEERKLYPLSIRKLVFSLSLER
jgi:hypothetical protein